MFYIFSIFYRCFFDSGNGKLANLIFTTIPLPIIVVANCVMYSLTFFKIRRQVKTIQETLGSMTSSQRAPIKAARAMSMFVLALICQWWAVAVHGVYRLFTESDEDIPMFLFFCAVIFSNTGGVLNLLVYILIRRQNLNSRDKHVNTCSQMSSVSILNHDITSGVNK